MKNLKSSNFNQTIKKGRVLVDFFGIWCGPCEMLESVLNELDNEFPDIDFYTCNVDTEVEAVKEYKVMSVPSLLFFVDGKLVKTINGFQPKETLRRFLDYYGKKEAS